MDLSNTRVVPAPMATVWAALNDPAVLKDCLPGCESIERNADDTWQVAVAARIGPVSARFSGRMTMADITPPTGYTLTFEGQGGAAGFAKGDARVTLAPAPDNQTALTYVAKAQVGGKLAQIGSRLIDGAAAKMTDDFFSRFVERVRAGVPGAAGAIAFVAAPAAPRSTHWVRYAAIAAIIVILIILYARGFR
jgi:carbon monoxide dehydrogenase subunit G